MPCVALPCLDSSTGESIRAMKQRDSYHFGFSAPLVWRNHPGLQENTNRCSILPEPQDSTYRSVS